MDITHTPIGTKFIVRAGGQLDGRVATLVYTARAGRGQWSWWSTKKAFAGGQLDGRVATLVYTARASDTSPWVTYTHYATARRIEGLA